MQFYRITGKLIKKTEPKPEKEAETVQVQEQETEEVPGLRREHARRHRDMQNEEFEKKQDIREITERFNSGREKGNAIVISNWTGTKIVLAAVTDSAEHMMAMSDAYISALGEELESAEFEEETFDNFEKQVNYSSRRSYISDDDEVMEALDLADLGRMSRFGINSGENLIHRKKRKELEKEASSIMVEEKLLPELERIYTPPKGKKKILGHPVHYLVSTDDRDVRRQTYQILLSALYEGKRLNNLRYVFTDFSGGQGFSEKALDQLYNSCIGGAMVIRYSSRGEEEDGEYACAERETIETLSGMINAYRNQVLTVLCLPRECSKSKGLFKEYLPDLSMVEINEELVSGKKAEGYLRRLCKERGVSADRRLLSRAEGGEQYLAEQLRKQFEEWFDQKLRTDCYPQYKEMVPSKIELVREKPRGSAYDELMEMVGLQNAKEVINNAIDYFKAQKVLADKGMVADRPNMNFIFTGAPGTAKTSVARLFARIMKENGILSKGELHEVNRHNLIAGYVGQTALKTQKEVEAARGSVFFLDEAYAICDDRSGSFADECINTLVTAIENERESTVFIFAGYKDKMEQFLEKNEGLRSRIAFHVHFDNYSTDELLEISALIAKQKGLVLSDGAKQKIRELCEEARKKEDFGNGRYCRNIIEKAKMRQASRLLKTDLEKITEAEVKTITEEDIEIPDGMKDSGEQKVIGFQVA